MNVTWDLSQLIFHHEPSTQPCSSPLDSSNHQREENSVHCDSEGASVDGLGSTVADFAFNGTALYLYGDRSHVNSLSIDNVQVALMDNLSTHLIGSNSSLFGYSHTASIGFDESCSTEQARQAISKIEITTEDAVANLQNSKLVFNERYHLYRRQSSSSAPSSVSPSASPSNSSSAAAPSGSSNSTAPPQPQLPPPRTFSLPAIIGVACGVLALLLVALAVITWFYFKNRKMTSEHGANSQESKYPSTHLSSQPPRNPGMSFAAPPDPFGRGGSIAQRVSFANRGMNGGARPGAHSPSLDSPRANVQALPFAPRPPFSNLLPRPGSPPTSLSSLQLGHQSSRSFGQTNSAPGSATTPLIPRTNAGDGDDELTPSTVLANGRLGGITAIDTPLGEGNHGDGHIPDLQLPAAKAKQEGDDTVDYSDDTHGFPNGRPPTYRSQDPHLADVPVDESQIGKAITANEPIRASVDQTRPEPAREGGSLDMVDEAEALNLLASRAPRVSGGSADLPSPPPSRPTSSRPNLVARGISANPAVYAPIRNRAQSEASLTESQQTMSPYARPFVTPDESPRDAEMLSPGRAQSPTTSVLSKDDPRRVIRSDNGQILESAWF